MHNKALRRSFYETLKVFEPDGDNRRYGPDCKTTREQEYCRILIACDGLAEAAHLVDDLIKERFEEPYKAWKENREAAHQGHTIEEWPAIFSSKHGDLPPPKQIAELHANNIFTVEDLAALSDGNLFAVHHGRELRQKAQAWLADKEGHAVTDQLAVQLAQAQGELEAMRRQIAKLTAAPRRKKKMSGAMRKKLNEGRVRNAPKPAGEAVQPEQPSLDPAA
jgi:hypothetical protein